MLEIDEKTVSERMHKEAEQVHSKFIEDMYTLFGLPSPPGKISIEIKYNLPITKSYSTWSLKDNRYDKMHIGENTVGTLLSTDGMISLAGYISAHETSHYLHWKYLTEIKRLNAKEFKNIELSVRELIATLGSQIFFGKNIENVLSQLNADLIPLREKMVSEKVHEKKRLLKGICRKEHREDVLETIKSAGIDENLLIGLEKILQKK